MLDIYRCRAHESHIWRSIYETKIQTIPVLIVDAYHFEYQIHGRHTIIKDIPLLEDIVRRRTSKEISFDRLYSALSSLPSGESIIHVSDMISIIRDIYESSVERPTGPLASPPGGHGETYFITQSMLWNRGHKWLIHASRTLEKRWQQWKGENQMQHPRNIAINIEYIDYSIDIFLRYHTI